MAGGTGSLPNFSFLKSIVRDQLVDILESVTGKKDLVIDPKLMKPLDHVAGATFLKEHGVNKIFKLERQKLDVECNKRIYLLRPSMVLTKYVADHINSDKRNHIAREYKIVFAPRKMYVCEMVLEQEGVYGAATLDELAFDIIPLDQDILSMELPEFFKDFFLDSDQSWVYSIAKSLMILQSMYGTIPTVYGLGRSAKMVMEILEDLIKEEGEYKPVEGPEIGSLIIIDRDVDLITPLCSQVTYEGLLDDTFGTKSGFIEFGPDVTGKDQTAKLLLNSNDAVFNDIRDRHFSNVFGYLSQKAKVLQTGYDKRHELSSVTDMKNFVSVELKDLRQQHKSLALHIGACEVVLKKKASEDFERLLQTEHNILELTDNKESLDYIEESMMRQFSSTNALRLLCLLSLTHGGLDPKLHKSLKQQYLLSYGYEYLSTFSNLKKLGLYTETDRKSVYKVASKRLNLVPRSAEQINLKNPSHMAYVFGGAYTPISCKLVEQIQHGGGISLIEDLTRSMGVEVSTTRRPGSVSRVSLSMRSENDSTLWVETGNPRPAERSLGLDKQTINDPSAGSPPKNRPTLVMFMGGCTYSEITALRFLGRQKGCCYITGTTSITNSKRTLTSLIEHATES